MSLQRTPLYDAHLALGARLVPFGGWEMPVQYQGIVAEHLACRAAAGLFDVSHMGEFEVAGPSAATFLEQALTNRVSDLAPSRCRYSLMCNDAGGIIDDLLVYRLDDERWLLVVNAGNIATDLAWLRGLAVHQRAAITDRSPETALLALQGPASRRLLQRLLPAADGERLGSLRYYQFGEFALLGVSVLISRTGYTGDLGYELAMPADSARRVWDYLLAEGSADGLVPVGLGARDTLRLEAGFCLHGHDISPQRNPIESGLERFVKLDKEFVGRDALAEAASLGTPERLIGLVVTGRGIVREGAELRHAGQAVGVVTSGGFSPSLQQSIGLGYVRCNMAAPGTALEVVVRDRPVACTVTTPPFYRRS
ncbi:MAG: glycine cleavage system aminomethyltransferase GcvT [Armatimonadetes bacterium]|nr:glycine cleavage system aminomethyltransferase GcvT [Armatimonadota bacterium]